MDAQSGWWVVAYTEFAGKVPAFILDEAWDNCRLWTLSGDMLRLIYNLDLQVVLGDEANAEECRRLLTAVSYTHLTLPTILLV